MKKRKPKSVDFRHSEQSKGSTMLKWAKKLLKIKPSPSPIVWEEADDVTESKPKPRCGDFCTYPGCVCEE